MSDSAAPQPDMPDQPDMPRQGFFRRLVNTPLSDLFRGRLSGRLDIRFQIEQAKLPPAARRIVLDVVGRTRLWPKEKAEVAGELISHFAEGNDAGATGDQLSAAFGPTRRAARLIRRAKRRGRSLAWRIGHRTLQLVALVLAVIVGIYLAATIRLFYGKPVIAEDYLAMLNAAAVAVPESQRAWPHYREALVRLDVPLNLRQRWPDVDTARPGDPQWYEIADFLEDRAADLEQIREASKMPGLGFVAGHAVDEADLALWPDQEGMTTNPEFGLTTVLLQHVAELRSAGQLLALDAYRAAAAGDGAVSAGDVAAIFGIAEHVREVPFLINELTSLSCVRLGVQALGEILSSEPEILTNGELRDLAHRLAALQGGGALAVRLDAEYLWVQDMMQRLYTDNGRGDGHLTARGLASLDAAGGQPATIGPLAPVLGLVVAGREEMTREFMRLFAMVQAEQAKPLWHQNADRLDGELDRIKCSRLYTVRYFPVALLMPALGRAGRGAELVTQQRDAVSVAIALELYRRRHGFWPQSLDDLVPDLLPEVPRDRFDGAALRYRIAGGRPVLYSVGTNGVDDGGTAALAVTGRTNFGNPPSEGDWILWPVGKTAISHQPSAIRDEPTASLRSPLQAVDPSDSASEAMPQIFP